MVGPVGAAERQDAAFLRLGGWSPTQGSLWSGAPRRTVPQGGQHWPLLSPTSGAQPDTPRRAVTANTHVTVPKRVSGERRRSFLSNNTSRDKHRLCSPRGDQTPSRRAIEPPECGVRPCPGRVRPIGSPPLCGRPVLPPDPAACQSLLWGLPVLVQALTTTPSPTPAERPPVSQSSGGDARRPGHGCGWSSSRSPQVAFQPSPCRFW